MKVDISFPGGVAVEGGTRGFSVLTDQPQGGGGSDAAPNPFELFLISLGTCSGYFALRFCNERGINPKGLALALDAEKGTEGKKLDRVSIRITLPDEFPDKYRQAIVKATDMCAVKQVILDPPEFITTIV